MYTYVCSYMQNTRESYKCTGIIHTYLLFYVYEYINIHVHIYVCSYMQNKCESYNCTGIYTYILTIFMCMSIYTFVCIYMYELICNVSVEKMVLNQNKEKRLFIAFRNLVNIQSSGFHFYILCVYVILACVCVCV